MTLSLRRTDADEIGANLPFLRRYARALTGNRETGDQYAAATLEAILAEPSVYDGDYPPDVALFRAFHLIWATSGAPVAENAETGGAVSAQSHLSRLTPNTREALLLHTVEAFPPDAICQIMEISASEAADLLDTAYREMARAVTGQVMIIEDEPIIALDIENIVTEMGHEVLGIARTETEALTLAGKDNGYNLILADIQLADDSSGADAVERLADRHGPRPSIFITAFPERLLTGHGPEPAFLISKPYTDAQVRAAVSQAMFFTTAETAETLRA